MLVKITGRNFTATEDIRSHIEHRLNFATQKFEEKISQISIRIRDINGPKGGVDKECHIHLRLKGMPSIIIKQSATNIYTAVDLATDRLAQTISRKIARTTINTRKTINNHLEWAY